MIQISQSELATWFRCPRKWFTHYYLGFTPADTPATGSMQLGSRVHACLEGWRGHGLDPLALLQMIYRLEAEKRPDDAEALAAEMDLADAMVSGYLEWLATEGEDAELTTVAAEAELTVPLPGVDGVELRARLDAVVLRSDGVLLFRDYKTSGSFEKHEVLELDPQLRFYSLMQHLLASRVQNAPAVLGAVIHTLRRVKRSSRSSPPYYKSDTIRYNPEVIRSTLLRVSQGCREITEARRALDWCYTEGGGDLDLVNAYQLTQLRPVQMPADCSWSCPLSKGTCVAMDDGSDWPGIFTRSGHFAQGDPYGYYQESGQLLEAARAEMARLP